MRRSSRAPVSLSEPKTSVHSSKGRLVVTRTDPLSYLWLKTSKRELRAGLGKWYEAKLVDDEQLESGQLLLEVEQSPLVPGLDQLVDQRGGRGEADRQSPLAGGEPQTEGHMGLAG